MPEQVEVTLLIPDDLLTQARAAVEAGLADSTSALFREALRRRLEELWEEDLEKTFQEAAADPDFRADLHDTMSAFSSADAEVASRLPIPKLSSRRASAKKASAI